MLDRACAGELPPKHHVQLRGPDGALRWEHCLTREGFDGPYTIAYHVEGPHRARSTEPRHGWAAPVEAPPVGLRRRHFRGPDLTSTAGPPVDARVPLLFNRDVVLSLARPTEPDPCYVVNADGDELLFIEHGGGVLRSPMGDLRFEAMDYVFIPRGVHHRLIPDAGPQTWLSIECLGGLHLPHQWRNAVGQLRMDAPYCHRDFRRPRFDGPVDEGLRHTVVKRGGWSGFDTDHSPLDCVGWDGTVYPWAFPMLAFQPRVSSVHLPPTWHGTFGARGALICSFVPRPVDFHPDAIPCPYPHSSVDVDEVLYYVRGHFTSRRGVGPGSISYHPSGVAHGPHPGAYEASLGTTRTDEVAVMLDVVDPLRVTTAAATIEQAGYNESFMP